MIGTTPRPAPEDIAMMARALRLAKRGFPAPNPHVGAVLARGGAIVGEGFHAFAGGPHAEAAALSKAGHAAAGATLYVTLEPCSHHGRTPPCADAVIAAGITRVMVATLDPDPRVAGRGIERLRAAGITAEVGLMSDEAQLLNEQFFHFHHTGRPFVMVKAAMTMDGKIASASGDSKWITSAPARLEARRMRARCGAVLVGFRTARLDNPSLTARLRGVRNPPRRVVLDRDLSLSLDARLYRDVAAPTLVVTASSDAVRRESLADLGVDTVRIEWVQGHPDLPALLAALAQRGHTGLLVEGGGETIALFIEQALVDKVAFFYAPLILGGREAITAVEGRGAASIADALQLERVTHRKLGRDWLVTGYPIRR